MKKSCTQCSAELEITTDDLAFYDKVSPVFNGKKEIIPPPTMCPACRMQRRLTFRNEKSLHHRTCDQNGKSIISMYAPSVPFPVYDNEMWWKDDWNPYKAAQAYDPSEPFLSQFTRLWQNVPKMARVQQGVAENA